jgi:hypothetical protein
MKKAILLAVLVLVPLALVGYQASIALTCVDGVTYGGNCAAGHVTFLGVGFPNQVHITVTRNSTGDVYDDFDYDASTGGILKFTETLYPGDTYTVQIGTTSQTVTTVTTGDGN